MLQVPAKLREKSIQILIIEAVNERTNHCQNPR